MRENLIINKKVLYKLKNSVNIKPTITLSTIDALDVYNLKKHSPNVKSERQYRVCMSHLPNDGLINRFAVKMKDFDINIGINTVSIKEVSLDKMKNWKEYKAIQSQVKGFLPYEEVTSMDINEFVKFCRENLITEEMLWTLLLDDTYSKSEEILLSFYPTIIPLPHYATYLQRYNSHGILLTQAKTGKSETCYRIYPKENYEDITVVTLLGTITDNIRKTGVLDGCGIFFVDEINKMKIINIGEENQKMLDFINTYLEKGIENRGIRGHILSVEGTKTVILSGNVNTTNPCIRDFFHLMNKICSFSGDADKFGRRFGWVVYSNNLNYVNEKREVDSKIIKIINCFRNEIVRDKTIQKKILRLIDNKLDWINEKDNEHTKKILSFTNTPNISVNSFITGMSLSNHFKLKFMSLRIILTNHIFDIIENKTKGFFEKYDNELNDTYTKLKEVMCYRQLKNLSVTTETQGKEKFILYIKENNINLSERTDLETKEKWSKELGITVNQLTRLIKEVKITPNVEIEKEEKEIKFE